MKLSGEMRDEKDDRRMADLGATLDNGMGHAIGKLRSKSYSEMICTEQDLGQLELIQLPTKNIIPCLIPIVSHDSRKSHPPSNP
jgi:hypothetical protein